MLFRSKDGDKQLMHTSLDGIWLYDFYQNKNRLLSIGYSWDSCVLTGAGFSIDDAIDSAYDRLENIDMDANVVRPKFDFISMEYPTAIFNRYNYVVEHNLIMGEAIEGRSVDERVKILERKVEQEKQKHRHEMGAIRAQLLSALDDGEE